MPRTGLEPARLSALAPETSASTIPPPGHCECKVNNFFWFHQIFLQLSSIFFYHSHGSFILDIHSAELSRWGAERQRALRYRASISVCCTRSWERMRRHRYAGRWLLIVNERTVYHSQIFHLAFEVYGQCSDAASAHSTLRSVARSKVRIHHALSSTPLLRVCHMS